VLLTRSGWALTLTLTYVDVKEQVNQRIRDNRRISVHETAFGRKLSCDEVKEKVQKWLEAQEKNKLF
jgi:hypothetical protein